MIKVKCIDASYSYNTLKVGEVYDAIIEAFDDYLIDGIWWSKSRFELVKEADQTSHRQKMRELLPIIQAYCDGAEVEALVSNGTWKDYKEPLFGLDMRIRIKQAPDTIDWGHVHGDYKWMARDKSGHVYLYTGKPELNKTGWVARGWEQIKARSYSSYKQGTVSWEDSLVERPEEI